MNKIKELFKTKETRRALFFTLGILFIYRLGVGLTLPGVNHSALIDIKGTEFINLINVLGGGTIERFSIFAMGISPYITASIVIELLSSDVIPILTKWKKEGATGKRKKDKVTRIFSFFLSMAQAFVLTYTFQNNYGILRSGDVWNYLYMMVLMTSGTMIAVWFGDLITRRGIGNGQSIIIFTGIVSNLPTMFNNSYNAIVTWGKNILTDHLWFTLFVIAYLTMVLFTVFVEGSLRKLPVITSSDAGVKMRTKEQNHIPMKINAGGVVPVIFASSIMAVPRVIISFISTTNPTLNSISDCLNYSTTPGIFIYIGLVGIFTMFYAGTVIDAKQISKSLSQSGGNIVGIRSGIETVQYIKTVLRRITLAGAVSLMIIATVPIVVPMLWIKVATASVTIGGTSLIICTGVAIETVKKLNAKLTRKNYKSLLGGRR